MTPRKDRAATTASIPTAPNGWPSALLRGFRDGETQALRTVYRMYVDEVVGQLRFGFSFESRGQVHRFVGHRSAFDLHDALHETFRRAFEPRARTGYDGIRPYGAYLRTIARNVVLKSFRRGREVLFESVGERGSTEDGEEGSPEQALASAETRDLVRRFLTTLDPEARRLVTVRFVEGKSQRDAAAILGLGRQQVRSREARLRERLVAFLHAEGEGGLVPPAAATSLLVLLGALLEGAR